MHHALPYGGHHLWVTVVPLSQGHGNTGDAVLFGAKKSLRVFRTDATTSGLTTQCTSVTM